MQLPISTLSQNSSPYPPSPCSLSPLLFLTLCPGNQVIRLSGYPLRPRSESVQCGVGGRQAAPILSAAPNILPRPKPAPAFARFAIGKQAQPRSKSNNTRRLTSWLSGLHLCLEIFPGSSTWGPS